MVLVLVLALTLVLPLALLRGRASTGTILGSISTIARLSRRFRRGPTSMQITLHFPTRNRTARTKRTLRNVVRVLVPNLILRLGMSSTKPTFTRRLQGGRWKRTG
ncbi:hypothetical protein PF010_g22309 [Phytophthora fragariae]|uniref:RxLR effector protein n=1 Tax=Phytophthora fragariae TaxID=53985 RepID=A0A6A3RTD4_9STRA|nr:hypothetical protein PF003_g8092 [Phytophthora fragariae]KAE8925464.1 hypothetical protein PF009_g24325 [Phytophthora fragariae]KAE8951630.1 hypothetical protein PF011_g32911 [Phytophthora fragariae]KAE9054867.1 hypothetical protein PF007_g32503 [Phytophthora fragariae]KAE9080637.1 hypothetical protein PF010_g22309 [Phytophthora fragariae]